MFRLGLFLIGVSLSITANNYVNQLRGQIIGFCPPGVVSEGPAVAVFDTRTGRVFCSSMPLPPREPMIVEPHRDSKKEGI